MTETDGNAKSAPEPARLSLLDKLKRIGLVAESAPEPSRPNPLNKVQQPSNIKADVKTSRPRPEKDPSKK